MDSNLQQPFKTLGTRLKYLREHSKETIAEAAGAVEINEDTLALIEDGAERPSEEILMLLINHFNMLDSEAVQLWELAGYDRSTPPEMIDFSTEQPDGGGTSTRPAIMMLALDMRTQYSDGVNITVNKAGAVMSFTQAGPQNQPQTVAKVGMSLQQAEAVLQTLQKALLHARYDRPKALPAPTDSSSPSAPPAGS